MKKIYPAKDPQEVLPYGFNWTPRNIGTETITAIGADVLDGSCVVDSSVVGEVPNARTGQGTIHIISGGTDGELCEIKLTATTNAGNVLEQTVYLPIRQK